MVSPVQEEYKVTSLIYDFHNSFSMVAITTKFYEFTKIAA